jgi:hypothetical protein
MNRKGHQISNEERDMIMKAAAQTNGTIVNEEMTTIGEGGGEEEEKEISTTYSGMFVE